MADNGTAASGPTIAWDDIGGVAYQRVKVAVGVDGAASDLQPATTGQVASGTASVQVVTGAAILLGWSFREDAGTAAAAVVEIRDGTDDTGALLGVVNLASDESVRDWFGPQGLAVATGIRVVKPAGTSLGTIWYV